jgi:hypothetical protein
MKLTLEVQLGSEWCILSEYELKDDFDFETLKRIGADAVLVALRTSYRGPARIVEDGRVVFEVDSAIKLLDGIHLKPAPVAKSAAEIMKAAGVPNMLEGRKLTLFLGPKPEKKGGPIDPEDMKCY